MTQVSLEEVNTKVEVVEERLDALSNSTNQGLTELKTQVAMHYEKHNASMIKITESFGEVKVMKNKVETLADSSKWLFRTVVVSIFIPIILFWLRG